MIAAWWMLAARAEPVAVEVSVGAVVHRNHLSSQGRTPSPPDPGSRPGTTG